MAPVKSMYPSTQGPQNVTGIGGQTGPGRVCMCVCVCVCVGVCVCVCVCLKLCVFMVCLLHGACNVSVLIYLHLTIKKI